MTLCGKPLPSRAKGKQDPVGGRRCFRELSHEGKCAESHYLEHLKSCHPKVAQKIIRDATLTTGAAWKSKAAGPNRATRWSVLPSDGKPPKFEPLIEKKLREKAATYEECMNVARRLAHAVYGMANAPEPPPAIRAYLESFFGPIIPGSTGCLICRDPLNFKDFEEARRGRAKLETAHSAPRSHTADNVGFAHRECNIAQGNRSLDDFYAWIKGILERTGRV
jgi:hypothetical protein